MALNYGTPVEYNKISPQEIYIEIPVHHRTEGFIGVLRILFTAAEVITAFIPGVGTAISAAFALGQAALTITSYEQGNIRGVGNLILSLAMDVLPITGQGVKIVRDFIRPAAIVVEDLESTLETLKVNRIFIRGTEEYKANFKVLKTEGLKRVGKVIKTDEGLMKITPLRKNNLVKYRQAYLKQQARLGKDTSMVEFDDFELQMNNLFPNATNEDRALIRRLKYLQNLSGGTETLQYLEKVQETANGLSKQLKGYIRNSGQDSRLLLDRLGDYSRNRRLTSRINRIFAHGESDWASKEFWRQVKNGKILKSSNFWTQAAQSLNANDVGRELITKPFNALIRKNKKFLNNYYEKWVEKWLKKHAWDEIAEADAKDFMYFDGEVISKASLDEFAESRYVKRNVFASRYEIKDPLKKTFKYKGGSHQFIAKKFLIKVITKSVMYNAKVKKLLDREGRWFGGSLVLGYRVLQEVGVGEKIIQIYFNKVNTYARSGKNVGGKKEIILPITDHMLRQWRHASSQSVWYLRHLAMSRGGRAIAFEITSELFANFLAFIPLPALRNFLSIVSNFKGVAKDISAGVYFNQWWGKFEKTVKRLWIHKVGKLAGSSLYIFGHAAGREGSRIGLGIARSFQHSRGQRLGSFRANELLKNTLPKSIKGTALRSGQMRARGPGGHRNSGQARLSIKRYGTNVRRIFSIPKIK